MYNKNSYLKDISISIYYDKDTYTLFIFYLHQGDNLMNQMYKNLKAENNAIILDVREDYEYKEGHIKGCLHIPLHMLEDHACEALEDLHQPIYVYCRAGVRSKVGCHILESQGYDKVYNLGAISDWPEELEK
jgi:phage shock protein E